MLAFVKLKEKITVHIFVFARKKPFDHQHSCDAR
jgi:hypothetical protein